MKKEVVILIVLLILINIALASVEIGDETYNFAPPFVGTTQLINLEHSQIDNTSFHIQAEISIGKGMIYKHVYYLSNDGWQQIALSTNDWTKNNIELGIDDQYSQFNLSEGDDFYFAAWVCEASGNSWECGCKDSGDCGYWYLQGIDLDIEGKTPILCSDNDLDNYGNPASEECVYSQKDCDDSNSSINPSATEILYNGIDDDCNISTLDDDLDMDGYLRVNDCDDENNLINPSSTEICEDLIDQDCSGSDLICEQCGEGSIPSTGCTCGGSSNYTGFCCDNIWQENPCGTPETIFHDGFESGTANTWDYLNPYSKVNMDLPQSGQFSLDLIYTPGTGETKTKQFAGVSLEEYKHLYFRWYNYFEEDFIQPIEGVIINKVQDADKDWSAGLEIRRWQGDSTQGRIILNIDDELNFTDTTIDNGEWNCFELEVLANDVSTNNGFIKLWINNVEIITRSGLTFGDGDKIGWYEQGGKYLGSFGSVPIHTYVDEVTISTQRIGC